jgi:Ca2+-transporting ATPase
MGLSDKDAEIRLDEFGLNKISIEKKRSKLKLFFSQFNNPIIYILMIAAAITIIIEDISDAIVIMIATLINTIVGYFQELKSDDAMKALARMAALKAKVRRNGKDVIIDSDKIVPGDIILLESGTKIPADLRLLETKNLSIDESMLTGESIHVQKMHDIIDGENIQLAEKINMAFSGTIVTRGRGIGVVIATGKNTEFGKIAKMISEQEQPLSPLQIRLAHFGKVLTFSIVGLIAFIFVMGHWIRNIELKQMALTAVGLAVAAIPEGLPIAVTVTLSIGLYKMSKRNAIIRRLAAVETLGSTTVICSDKTGTLTKNEMTVQEIYSGGNKFQLTGTGYNPTGEFLLDGLNVLPMDYPDLFLNLCIGSICNESKIEIEQDRYKVIGDPTEGALLVAGLKASLNHHESFKNFEINEIIPFESENQYMASLVTNKGKYYIFLKGSFEKVLDLCTGESVNGEILKIDPAAIRQNVDMMAGKGLRVLALAYKQLDILPKKFSESDISSGFIFSGLQGMMDPPREEVIEAIKNCYIAGIKVVMITGDHQKTAEVIASKLGIGENGEISVLTGKDLDKMSDRELYEKVNFTHVFARVTPNHKLRIVTQLRKHKHITAMTGDGVNDAPALKSSDIGVSMGSGTDVAKEASSMIVTDDNFASIFSAVKFGRVIYNNLQNILLFVLTTSLGGIMTILFSILAGLPLPFLPVHILWINVVTDGTSTVPLAFEEGDENLIYNKPRSPNASLITPRMAIRMIFTSILMSTIVLFLFNYELYKQQLSNNPDALTHAQTIAFTAFGLLQIFNAHNCRSQKRSIFSVGVFKNKYLLAVHSVSIILQYCIVQFEFGNYAFKTTPLEWNFSGWFEIVFVCIMLVGIVELLKFIERKYEKIVVL